MEFKTEYIELTVRLCHQNLTPLELLDTIEAGLRDRLPGVRMFDSDIEIQIDTHTGGCSTDYCGKEKQEDHP